MAARNKRQRCKRLEKRFSEHMRAMLKDLKVSPGVSLNKANLALDRAQRLDCRWVDDL